MNIDFNVWDTVVFLNKWKIRRGVICRLEVCVTSDHTSIIYDIRWTDLYKNEKEIFKSKDDMLNYLMLQDVEDMEPKDDDED